jgi:hypothetical protein
MTVERQLTESQYWRVCLFRSGPYWVDFNFNRRTTMSISYKHVLIGLFFFLAAVRSDCAQGGGKQTMLAGQKPRVMNNFVTEHILLDKLEAGGTYTIMFTNTRKGWLFFRLRGQVGKQGRMAITLMGKEGIKPLKVIVCEAGDVMIRESMRYVPKGEYTVQISLKNATLESLNVREIPAIIFASFPYKPKLAAFGQYDWPQLKQMGIFKNSNVIVTDDKEFPNMRQWLGEGKQVMQHTPVPSMKIASETKDVCRYWLAKHGINDPNFSGVLIDEFYYALEKRYPLYVSAIKRLRKTRPNKVVYPYIAGKAKELRGFLEPLKNTDCQFAYEHYLTELPTEGEAKYYMESTLKKQLVDIERYFPDFSSKCIYVLGFLSGPNESLNCNPSVSFKVFMDMQFHLLATDSVFDNLYGIEEYLSGYCDEEYLRWCAKLFRHYCIEGSSERLTRDPYVLSHIWNPDFTHGLKGWTVDAAEPGSVTTERMTDYGWNQGRYPEEQAPQGDSFLLMKRSKNKANRVSQKITNLTPGRYYSVKMYTSCYDDLARQAGNHAVRMFVEDAKPVPKENLQGEYATNKNHYIKKLGRVSTYFNYHRIVFKATSKTARLVISDWRSENKPRSEIGQRMMFNFIEVEPYLMPDTVKH